MAECFRLCWEHFPRSVWKALNHSLHCLSWCSGRSGTSTLGTFWSHFQDRYIRQPCFLSARLLGLRGITTLHKSLCAGSSAVFLLFSALGRNLTLLGRTDMGLVGDTFVTETDTSHWRGLSEATPADRPASLTTRLSRLINMHARQLCRHS